MYKLIQQYQADQTNEEKEREQQAIKTPPLKVVGKKRKKKKKSVTVPKVKPVTLEEQVKEERERRNPFLQLPFQQGSK